MKNDVLAGNILRLRNHLGLTQKAFAAEVDSEQPNVTRWEKQGNQPEPIPMARIAALAGWPVERFIYERWDPPSKSVEPDMPPTRFSEQDTVELISLDLSFAMGPGTEIDDYIEEMTVRYDLGLLRQLTRSSPHMLRLARGVGDSMFPTLHTSDRVLIDTSQRTLNLTDRIWAISLFGAAAIKRLRTIGPNRVLVISDNPDVPDQEVDADDLRIGGRVISLAAREL